MNSLSSSRPRAGHGSIGRLTGLAALLGGVLAMIELPLYFILSPCDTPSCTSGTLMPDPIVLTRVLIGIVGLTCYVIFMTGVRRLFGAADSVGGWFGALASSAGLLWLAVEFVAKGLEAGAVIRTAELIDPTREVSGTYILYGSIARLLVCVFAAAFGYAVLRTRLLPRWIAWSAFALAVVHLAFVPSLYFGYDSSFFYAANGWGSTASASGLFVLWMAAVGVTILITKPNLDHDPSETEAGPTSVRQHTAA